jgi:hypothetical protein
MLSRSAKIAATIRHIAFAGKDGVSMMSAGGHRVRFSCRGSTRYRSTGPRTAADSPTRAAAHTPVRLIRASGYIDSELNGQTGLSWGPKS